MDDDEPPRQLEDPVDNLPPLEEMDDYHLPPFELADDFNAEERDMLSLDMRVQLELDRMAEEAANEEPAPKDYPCGNDWTYCIPANQDGTKDALRDISRQAVWTLSSCKTDGYGIYELLHPSVDKYWQSDGPQPHTVTIEFQKKTDISFLFLYLDYKNDESYTPSKVIVHTGPSLMHLDDGREHEFSEPNGWQSIDLRNARRQPARAFVIQIQVIQNHQNGRDTHIRHIRVAGPMNPRCDPVDRMIIGDPNQVDDFNVTPINSINNKIIRSMIIR